MLPLRPLLITLAVAALLWGCDRQPAPPAPDEEPVALAPEGLPAATERAWDQSLQAARSTRTELLLLQQRIATLVKHPTADTLDAARQQWHSTHDRLLALAPLLALGDVNPGLFGQLQESRFQMDSWPLEPGYLDYFDVYPHSGVVNDIVIPISASAIREQHGFTSPADVVLGLHAMAYLLWGENQKRPLTDFVTTVPSEEQRLKGLTGADLPNQRRVSLLQLQATLALDELDTLIYRLEHPASGIRTTYMNLPPASRLELWQRGLHQVLTQELDRQLPIPTDPASDDYQHNAFAGQPARAINATLAGVESLLLGDTESAETPLIRYLNPAQDPADLRRQFAELQEALQAADAQWQELPPETLQDLQQRLGQLAESI